MSKKQPLADERRQAGQESQSADRGLKQIQDRQTKRENAFVQAAVGFLKTEVETGITLARIARESSDAEDKVRRCREARKAYDSVVEHRGKAANATSEELGALTQELATLRKLLESLGEKF